MRIAVVSDLHVDVNAGYPVDKALAEVLSASSADMLLIAGDISECFRTTISWVERFEQLAGIPVRYVPGNHDLWRCDALDNDGIYLEFVKDPRCLCSKTLILGRWAVVGDVGWYDYTLSPLYGGNCGFDAMEYGGRIWQDRIRNAWSLDNPGRTAIMLEKLDNMLCECEGKDVIAVTHMLVNKDFIVRGRGREWDYFDAFLGSAGIGGLFLRHPVRYSVSGHVHFRKSCEHDGISFICPCLGYFSEWGLYDAHHADDVMYQVRDSVRFMDI